MIQISALHIKQKDHQIPLLSNLSLSIDKGEVLAIIGASGCGKSVLINTIMNSLSSDFSVTGEINIDPTVQMALVPQYIGALNPTAKIGSQLAQFDPTKKWYQRKNTTAIHKALTFAQLPQSVASLYPYQLSGGMAKRVLSALAFIQNPDVIIADEPSCGINDEYVEPLFQHYQHLAHNEKKGVIIISHDLKHVIDIADRILVLNNNDDGNQLSSIEYTSPKHIKEGKSQPYSQALWKALPSHWE
ncbi:MULTISPECIES: ATP-binding cassette domain-containing protein [Aliivibrio]|uniref:ABC transporter ATP-binding protein n=1 Tax=Aliivibrio finisterrensis TaxID=511998 RepID=A0A4Q5KW78_9GAMM|nr:MULTISPECIES: ATP-binding cassette domain-containing protein [Aliivibrio]MDD9178635.1 ATP-binding cassette domain-containing protein [Aliivibrio sp. A6]RYU53067.1 ABC transporter ATP-binding protein [Aliivibrio finisterrensis]RYU55309.1 ABC transporter ATP-binding protein [Aliivibrio finisterrensis]RYU60096.1 ABC transporter ATP-binding protein [Aliivibrio finisterrensis]RYU63500.1 ABC transporter ATP-binding protein [Aliivibrio finisterrensis]